MTGERVDGATLNSLLEAARWAPSSRNRQHWRFRYALRGDDHWEAFLSVLKPGNRTWARDAGAILVVTTKERYDGDPERTHQFSAGAAFQNLALEGTRRDLAVHPMAGIDRERARELLSVPDDQAVQIGIAVGPAAPPEQLPDDLADRETPSSRDPVEEFAGAGPFEG
jgi:nitroreductase